MKKRIAWMPVLLSALLTVSLATIVLGWYWHQTQIAMMDMALVSNIQFRDFSYRKIRQHVKERDAASIDLVLSQLHESDMNTLRNIGSRFSNDGAMQQQIESSVISLEQQWLASQNPEEK